MTHSWALQDVPEEWMTVYDTGRIVTIRGIAVQELNGRYRFFVSLGARIETFVGSTSMAGEATIRTGWPLIGDNPEVAAILAATEGGDFSWNEPVVIDPPGRDLDSVSVFLPPSVDRAAIEACGILYDDSGDQHLDVDHVSFSWFRPLPSYLIPEPDTDHGRQLAACAQRWGGIGNWEVLAAGSQGLTAALLRLAEHHDLAAITVDHQFYDLDRLRWRVEHEGPAWRAGWSRWVTGHDDPDDYDDEEEVEEVAPRPRPVFPPGPELTGDHAEWAVIYDDGCVVFIHADTVDQAGRYLRFNAATVDGDSFNLGWVTAEGAKVFQGAPRLTDNPEAVTALTAVHWGQDPDQGLADTDIGSPPRISPPPPPD